MDPNNRSQLNPEEVACGNPGRISSTAESNSPVCDSSGPRLQSKIGLPAPDKQFETGIVLFSNSAFPACRFCPVRDNAESSARLPPRHREIPLPGLDSDDRR